MKHFQDLQVLTTHTKANLATLEFKIDKGLITWVGVFFPAGCHALVYARVFFQAHQILPRDPDQWCHGNDGWWGGDLYFPITAEPLKVKVEGWSNSCTYNHVITIGLEVTPWRYIPAWDKLVSLWKAFMNFIGAPIPEPTAEEEMMEK